MSDEAQVPGSKAQKAQMSAGASTPAQTCSHKLDGKGWCGRCKLSAIDDGAIGNREMESGDISVQHSMPGLNGLFPGDAKEQNQGASRLKEDESADALDPIVTDQRGTDDAMGWFQPTRFPDAPHRLQISIPEAGEDEGAPASTEIGVTASKHELTAALAWKMAHDPKWDALLMSAPVTHPGSDARPGRKSVPTGEGGVIGIPGIDGSSEHVVNPDESEKPVDEFKGGQPASSTVTDEFAYPKQKGQQTRQIGTYQFASVELFNPVDGDDLLLDL